MCVNFLLINGKKSSFMFGNSSHSFINRFWSFFWKVKVHKQVPDCTVAAQTTILGQALAQKLTWLPNINIKFWTQNDLLGPLPALKDAEVIDMSKEEDEQLFK